jgi:TP901 family phage tail tape measure protein
MADESIGVALTADTRSFVQGFNSAATAVGHLTKAAQGVKGAISGTVQAEMSKAKNVVIATGAAVIATGLRIRSSLKDFNALEVNMRNVATVADTSLMSLGKLTDGVRQLAISGKVTQDVNQLSEGLYNIASSGFQGADAMNVLAESAKAASAGLTDTITAGTGITQILNAYGLSAANAANVSDILFHTVNVGVLNFQQLAATTGQWASVTASMKVPLGEATAALAAMTKAGADADQAATALRTMMIAFINPSTEMTDLLTKLGYASGQALLEQEGLAGGLQKIVAASGGSATALQKLFQDVQGLNGVLQLTGPQAGFFAEQAKQMGTANGVAGETTKALAEQQKSLSAQWDMFKNQLTELKIELGSLISPLAKVAVGFGTNLVGALNKMPAPMRQLLAGLSLVTPALAVLAGAWVIHAVRAAIVAKAITGLLVPLKSLAIVARFPMLGSGLDFLGNIAQKGVLRTLAGHIMDVVKNSSTLRGALATLAGQGVIMAAKFGVVALAIYGVATAMGQAEDAAKSLISSMNITGLSGAKSIEDLGRQMDSIRSKAQQLNGQPGILDSLMGAAQVINPFDTNTILNEEVAVGELNKQYERLAETRGLLARIAGGKVDDAKTFDNVKKAAEAGVVDLNHLVDVYHEWQDLWEKKLSGGVSSEDENRIAQLDSELKQAKISVEDFSTSVKKTEMVAQAASSAQQNLAEDLAKLGNAAVDAKDKASAYGDMLDQLMDKSMGTRNAQAKAGEALRGFLQDMSDLKEAGTKINDALFDPFTEGGAKLQNSLANISSSMADWANQIFRTTGDAAQANNALVGMAGGFIEVAKQAGFSSQQIQQMLTLMGLTPATVQSIVSVPGADAAIAQLLTVDSTLNSLNGKVADAYVVVHVQAQGPPNPITGELPQGTVRAAGPPNPITGQYPDETTGPGGTPTIQKQIQDIIDAVKSSVNSGVLGAGTGFKPKTSGGGGGQKTEDTKLTPQEAASYAYQAGFRGEDLVRIVAIMGRESGYNPKAFNPNSATGDLSYGLTQINMIGSLGAQRRAAMGLGSNEELFDPLTNLRAAYQMYQESGGQLTPWGGYKGMSDTYNTDMGTARGAVESFLQNQGNYGGGSGGVMGFVDQMVQKALTTSLGQAATTAQTVSLQARKSVIENMTGLFSRTGQGIVNEAIQSGQDPTDQFNKVADSFDELTKKIGKDTAVQLLYYAGNAEEYKAMADEIIHQNELQMSKEDYMFSHAQMSTDDYKKILQERLTHVEQYSSEWVQLMDQIDQVEQDRNATIEKNDAKQRKLNDKQFQMNELSREDYIKYLNELITHYDKYSDQYMEIWGKLHDLQMEQEDATKQLTASLKDAWQQAYDDMADPIKSATSLIGAFGSSMDVTSESIKSFYGHVKEATSRWIDAVTKLKASGIDKGFLSDLIKQGPQSLTLAETILGMGSEGIGFINSSIGDIAAMTQQFGTGMLPAASVGTMIDNKVVITVGDVNVTAPGNVGLTQTDLVTLVNQVFGEVVARIQAGQKATP